MGFYRTQALTFENTGPTFLKLQLQLVSSLSTVVVLMCYYNGEYFSVHRTERYYI